VQQHIEDIRDNVLLIAPDASIELQHVFASD
jgi:hypothetical protein